METTWPPPPEISAPAADAAQEPRRPLSPLAVFWYSLANLGYGAFYVFNNAVLPLWLRAYTHNAVLLGMMAGTHSFEGAVIQPVVGSVSDRLRTRLGRRRPFMLIFVPISALFLLLTPLAGHAPGTVRLGLIVACIFLFTVAFNIALDPYQSLMADITPENQRGRIMGFWYFVGALGQIALLLLPLPLTVKIVLVAVLMLATTLLTCATTREPVHPPYAGPGRRNRDELREALRGLRTLRQAGIYLAAFFFLGAGTSTVVPFLTTFIKQITHCTDQEAQRMFVVLMASVAVGVVPCGWLADKIGPKKLLMVSTALIAVAALGGLRVQTLPHVAVVLALAGMGIAAQNASAYPLLTRLVPEEEVGFFTGLQTTALSIAEPASLAMTGALINHSGYRTIFGVCAVCVIIALCILSRLHPSKAPAEIGARDREQGRRTI